MGEHGHIIAVANASLHQRAPVQQHRHFVVSFIVRIRFHGHGTDHLIAKKRPRQQKKRGQQVFRRKGRAGETRKPFAHVQPGPKGARAQQRQRQRQRA